MREITEEWVHKAEHDFQAAHLAMHRAEYPLTDIVCFHSQQCVEKYFKAFLQERRVRFPREHALNPLLDLCLPADPTFESLRADADRLEGYAVAIRYPGADAPFELAERALAAATRVRAFVRDKLGLPG